jgi:superfamily II DNA or RNA helicase
MLRNLDLKIRYNTGEHRLVRDFYAPCLAESVEYSRAAGYFTSHGLSVAAQGVAGLIRNGGHMRLVASPNLTKEDIEAIRRGANGALDVIASAVARDMADVADFVATRRLEALTWMIREQLLRIRIAFKSDPVESGIYHEKSGVFRDSVGNRVAFSGSGNETIGGWEANYESLNVYCSWRSSAEYAVGIESDFERLWSNACDGISCLDFTEVAEDVLRPYTPRSRPMSDPAEEETALDEERAGPPRAVGVPSGIVLREYQKDAVRNWFGAGGRGVFKMATGSGKTITALAIAANLFQAGRSRCVLVIAPYTHLVRQWQAEARAFGFAVVTIHGSSEEWYDRVVRSIYTLEHSASPLCLIATNDSLRGAKLQSLIGDLPASAIIIADEVHNLGTEKLHRALPAQVRFRVGLSATPERHGDEEGTALIHQYFGKVLEPEFTLKDALTAGVLCPYEYRPVRVDFTDNEDGEFQKLSIAIARLSASPDSERSLEDGPCKMLLLKRARLVANAARKLDALRNVMSNHRHDTHMLVYCGSGHSDDLDDGDTRRNIERVCDLLGNELSMRVATFTHETDLERREELLKSLDSGDIQCLVAIRCLDEGVDVPSIRTAVVMASTSNPRQYVQRRGRLLRRSPGKKQALIYDLAVLPSVPAAGDRAISALVQRELRRAYEFGTLANNAGDACKRIVDWGLEYGVTIFDD